MFSFTHVALLLASTVATTTSSPLESASRLTLLPAITDEHDALDFEQLQPKNTITLSYSAEEDVNARFDTVLEAKYPTVVLERSAYIQDVTCRGNVINIVFDREAALAIALKWPSSGIALITNHRSCYDEHGQHGIHVVSAIRPASDNSLQLDLEARRATWEEFADTMQLVQSEPKPEIMEDNTSHDLRRRYSAPCTVTPVRNPSKEAICKAEGVALRPSIREIFHVGRKELTQCATRCHKDAACKSFSHSTWTGFCTLYGKALCDQRHSKRRSSLVFYDRECYRANAACSA